MDKDKKLEKSEKLKNEKSKKHENKVNNVEIENLKKQNTEINEKLLRVMAEIQNIKRRNEEERSNLLKYEGEDLVKKILPIVDNFERAIMLDDANLTDELSKFLDGFKMIYGNLLSVLKDKNVEEINCLDKAFDPYTMEAVLTEKVEGKNAGIVIDCLQKGYMYNDKVVRHAMVKVSE